MSSDDPEQRPTGGAVAAGGFDAMRMDRFRGQFGSVERKQMMEAQLRIAQNPKSFI